MSGGEDSLRASDAEREEVAERLREATSVGRLDPEELDRRLDAAYAAKTHAELAPLTADLPAPAAPRHPGEPAPTRSSQRLRRRAASFVTVNLICIGIWLASGAHGSFWPGWVLLGTGIGLLGSLSRRAFGVEEDEHRRERLERHERRAERRAGRGSELPPPPPPPQP